MNLIMRNTLKYNPISTYLYLFVLSVYNYYSYEHHKNNITKYTMHNSQTILEQYIIKVESVK